jgi:hypothetical protein
MAVLHNIFMGLSAIPLVPEHQLFMFKLRAVFLAMPKSIDLEQKLLTTLQNRHSWESVFEEFRQFVKMSHVIRLVWRR